MNVDDFYNFYDQLLICLLDLHSVDLLKMTKSIRNHSSFCRCIFNTIVNKNIKTSQFLLNFEKTIDSNSRSKNSSKSFESMNNFDKFVIFVFNDDNDVSSRKFSNTNLKKSKTIKIENAKAKTIVSDFEKSQISINLITVKYRNIKLILQNFNLSRLICKLQCDF